MASRTSGYSNYRPPSNTSTYRPNTGTYNPPTAPKPSTPAPPKTNSSSNTGSYKPPSAPTQNTQRSNTSSPDTGRYTPPSTQKSSTAKNTQRTSKPANTGSYNPPSAPKAPASTTTQKPIVTAADTGRYTPPTAAKQITASTGTTSNLSTVNANKKTAVTFSDVVKNASASISKAIANTAATAAAATRKTSSTSTSPIEIKTSPSGAKTASSLKQIASTASKTLSAIYNDVKKTIVTVSNSVRDQVSPPKKGLNNTQSILSKYEIIDIPPEMRGKFENPLNKESTSFGHAVCGKVFNDAIGSGKILAGKLINQAIGQKPMAGVDAFAYIREPANDLIRSGMANLQESAELKEKVAGNNIAEGFIFDTLCFVTDLGVSAAFGGGAKLISNKLAQSVTKSSLKKAVTSQIDDALANGAGKVKNVVPNKNPINLNPFKGKTPAEIDQMFKKKGFETRGADPINGYGGYVNP